MKSFSFWPRGFGWIFTAKSCLEHSWILKSSYLRANTALALGKGELSGVPALIGFWRSEWENIEQTGLVLQMLGTSRWNALPEEELAEFQGQE